MSRIVQVVGLLLVLIWCTSCMLAENTPPTPVATVSEISGFAPLTIQCTAIMSYDTDGAIVRFDWVFGDGGTGEGESIAHTYVLPGEYDLVLKVVDDAGATALTGVKIFVAE